MRLKTTVSGGPFMYSIAELIRTAAIRDCQERAKPDLTTMRDIIARTKEIGRPLLAVEDGNLWEFSDRSRLMFMQDKVTILTEG